MINLHVSPALFLFLAVFLWPGYLSPQRLKQLAFGLWLCGGGILTLYGLLRLHQAVAHEDATLFAVALMGISALCLGLLKGHFVFRKSCIRNLQRLRQFTEPQRALYVYSLRSWIIIIFMLLLATSLNWFDVSLLWRGGVNLTVGIALLISSLGYKKAHL